MRKYRSSRRHIEQEQKHPEASTAPSIRPVKEKVRHSRQKRKHNPLRAALAVTAGRAFGAISRRLHLGGGTSVPGVVAQRMYPGVVSYLAAQLAYGSLMITGTNGKTTTSNFVSSILRDAGLRVWRNREGSNLMRGIASSLVIRARPTGRLRRSGQAISVFEVDEATIPQALNEISPRIIVFNNLFRDQLDRYGEVDTVLTNWQKALEHLSPETILVLNADDPTIAQLGNSFKGQIVYFGINDTALNLQSEQTGEQNHQVIDTRTCSQCGHEYEYAVRIYSHLGHYRCPNCGQERAQPQISAVEVQTEGFDRYRIRVQAHGEEHTLIVPLPGLYNIYNALAAIAVARTLGIDWEPIENGIGQSKPVFGRGERIQADGKIIRLLLAKNPTGFNEVLRTLFADQEKRHVLFVLNDKIADGQDVSWIWDVDFERVVEHTSSLVLSGTRARDLGLRLKYAGVPEAEMAIIPSTPLRLQREERGNSARRKKKTATPITIETATHLYGLKQALDLALEQTPTGETLFIVPTYTGLLELHHELEERGLTSRYWEGRDG